MDLTTKIKTALKVAGLSEELFKFIIVDDEAKIDEAVKALKTSLDMSNEDFTKALNEAGFGANFEKYLQSETDRRVTAAIKTHDDKLKADADKKKKETPPPPPDPNLTEDQKTISELKGQITSLTESVKALLDGEKIKGIQGTIIAELKNAELPESLSKFIKTEDIEKVKSEVESLKTEFTAYKQTEIDKAIKNGTLPQIGANTGTIAEDKAVEFAKSKNKGASDETFEGKDIPGLTKE